MTNILWKASGRVLAISLLLPAIHPLQGRAQCSAAPIAAAACSGGNGAATDGVNVNSGETYWLSSASIFSSVNMNGGRLRICGNLTVSSINFNSGTIIVENGGHLTTSGLSTLNGNDTIINRGTIQLSGNLTIQNSNNFLYNDLSTSVFQAGGTVTVNSSTTTIVNRGNISFSGLNYQGAAGGFCVQDQSVTAIGVFTNNTTNGFTYSGVGSPACITVSGATTLNHPVTNSSNIHVCQQSGATVTGAGGWGSAMVATNCSSCTTVLPMSIDNFTATKLGDLVQLHWATGLGGNGTFYVERSTEGVNFETIGSVTANAGESEYTLTDAHVTAPTLYYRIRSVSTTGVTLYSTVAVIERAADGQLQLFPNPAGPNMTITIVVPAFSNAYAEISLIDMAGQVLHTKMVLLSTGSNTVSWGLWHLSAGVYLVRVALPGGNLYGRLAVPNH